MSTALISTQCFILVFAPQAPFSLSRENSGKEREKGDTKARVPLRRDFIRLEPDAPPGREPVPPWGPPPVSDGAAFLSRCVCLFVCTEYKLLSLRRHHFLYREKMVEKSEKRGVRPPFQTPGGLCVIRSAHFAWGVRGLGSCNRLR